MTMSSGSGSAETVLIVDDDALIRLQLTDIVKEAGFRPVAAGSAEEARPLLAEKPSVIFLDYTLPGQSGDAFCREVRLGEQTWSTPVVMVTGAEDAESIRRCLVSGADDYVVKPVQPHEIIAKLDAVRGGGEPGFQRRLEKKRVLLATQDAYFLENIARVLTASGCEVVKALELTSAMRVMTGKARPDVAVLDVDALSAEGIEQLRQSEPPSGTPATLLTIASAKTMKHRGEDWKTPRLWSALAPFDAETDRDDILRHLSRALTLGATRGSTRRKMRVPFFSAVRFRWADEPTWTNGIGFDLSESGIFVRSLAPLRPARRVVELTFRVGDATVSTKATVVWANAYGPRHIVTLPFGMGLSFTEVPERETEVIRAYVSRRLDTPRGG